MRLTASSSQTEEVMTLSISSPLFENYTAKSATVEPDQNAGWRRWTVTLSKCGRSLLINVRPNKTPRSYNSDEDEGGFSQGHRYDSNSSSDEDDFPGYKSMHVFPRYGYESSSTAAVASKDFSDYFQWTLGNTRQCIVDNAEKLLAGDRYDFNIVFSTGLKYERTTPLPPPPSCNPVLVTSLRPSDNIKKLMRDAHSVDVCFVFPSYTPYANIGLWAHRAILSTHAALAQLMSDFEVNRQSRRRGSKKLIYYNYPSNVSPPVARSRMDLYATAQDTGPTPSFYHGTLIPTNRKDVFLKTLNHSLSTMCTLIHWIYTGEIQLSVNTSDFAVTHDNGTYLTWYENSRTDSNNDFWSANDHRSSGRLEDTTWNELLEVANYFEIEELAVRCRPEVIAGFTPSNIHKFLNHHGLFATTTTATGRITRPGDFQVQQAAERFYALNK